jgi:hypothetical protein
VKKDVAGGIGEDVEECVGSDGPVLGREER